MTLEKEGGGTRITQPDSETIRVFEGEGSARAIGVIFLLGGVLLMWSNVNKAADITFIFGALLALFGAAIATQRYTMTLDRLKGVWSYGGDVLFVISFKRRGLLAEVGPVHIGRLLTNPREHNMGEPVVTHPVYVEARKLDGGKDELRFGQYWSINEAYEISSQLADFLDRSVQDDSNKESQ
ncbi:MAG TPA: hypothetical protein ENJ80_15270 [Gammaproteobacteria bacterium]|nr:hypothetical protein [Gammaproteobacteria bacterium]